MKQNLKLSGEVELSQEEVTQAMLEYLKTEKKLLEAMDRFLSTKHGYRVTKSQLSTNRDGEIVVVCEVNQVTNEGVRKPQLPQAKEHSGEKKQPTGFKRENVGFFRELVSYLQDERKKKRKEVPFDEALETMKFLFPTLDKRKFQIYVRDRRQAAAKGFRFDSQKRAFIL